MSGPEPVDVAPAGSVTDAPAALTGAPTSGGPSVPELGHLEPHGRDPRQVYDAYRGEWRYLTVHEALARIVAELPAIGKNQRNVEQGFNFRGIDDVLNALNPLLGRYGVHYLPDVLERVATVRTTRGGSSMYEVNLHVRYTFYGPAGDEVAGSGWGEGTDMGDKATNKAMTGAMKYVLFQVFAIATAEQSEIDSDRHTVEETGPAPQATEQQVVALINRLKPIHDRLGDYPQEWRDNRATSGKPGTYAIESLEQMATGERAMAPLAAAERMAQLLDEIDARLEAEDIAAQPCQLCGSTRAQRVLVSGVVRCSNASDCEKRAAKAAEPAQEPAEGDGAADGTGEATEGQEPAAVICTGCGEPITGTPTWDNDEAPWHAECSPMLG